MEIRFVAGRFDRRGPAAGWFRLRCPVVAGEAPSPVQRAVAAADFGNGISAELDFRTDLFINPDLTVSLRPAARWASGSASTPAPGSASRGSGPPSRSCGTSGAGSAGPCRTSSWSRTGDRRRVPEGTPAVADLLVARADDDRPGRGRRGRPVDAGPESVAAERGPGRAAALARADLDPPHVGVLLGNEPEYLFWLGAAALAGAVVVGINPTRRGEALAGDVRRTDCRVLVTDADGAALLDGLDTGVPADRVLRVDDPGYAGPGGRARRHRRPPTWWPLPRPRPDDLFLLLFTSGTTGDPKAVRCTQGRLASIALRSAEAYGFDRDDVAYCTMPLFHGNALMVLWGPSLVVGATVALAPPVQRLGLPARRPPLRRHHLHLRGQGPGLRAGHARPAPTTPRAPCAGASAPRPRWPTTPRSSERFGCVLTEGYGSSEGGVAINRVPGTPVGSLGPAGRRRGRARPGDRCEECPPAEFDAAGAPGQRRRGHRRDRQPVGPGPVRGLLRRPRGRRPQRIRHGWYWTGDLAYRDADGFFYFAGRGGDWMRVDSENLTAGPIERVLVRHADVAAVAVYPVPDPRSGDQVMAAARAAPRPRRSIPDGFAGFLAGAGRPRHQVGARRFVRVTGALPQTASGKVTKGPLRTDGLVGVRRPGLPADRGRTTGAGLRAPRRRPATAALLERVPPPRPRSAWSADDRPSPRAPAPGPTGRRRLGARVLDRLDAFQQRHRRPAVRRRHGGQVPRRPGRPAGQPAGLRRVPGRLPPGAAPAHAGRDRSCSATGRSSRRSSTPPCGSSPTSGDELRANITGLSGPQHGRPARGAGLWLLYGCLRLSRSAQVLMATVWAVPRDRLPRFDRLAAPGASGFLVVLGVGFVAGGALAGHRQLRRARAGLGPGRAGRLAGRQRR